VVAVLAKVHFGSSLDKFMWRKFRRVLLDDKDVAEIVVMLSSARISAGIQGNLSLMVLFRDNPRSKLLKHSQMAD
jgi:hypothetical protein